MPSLNLCQHILKNFIVVLHAIIQVDLDHLIGKVMYFFFVDPDLLGLRLKLGQLFGQLHPLGSGRTVDSLLQISDGRAIPGLLLMDIVRADTSDGIRLIAVHVDQALEAVLFAAIEEPVDRALAGASHRISRTMIRIEIIDEVVPDDLTGGTLAAEGIGNESQVFFECCFSEGYFNEFDKATYDVILEIFIVTAWDDGILVWREGHVLGLIPFAPRVDKTGNIERIAAEHTSHGVGNEAPDVPFQICSADSHVFIFHLWGQLILQAVNINEDAIELLLVGFELGEAFITLSLPLPVGLRDGGSRPNQRMPLEVPGDFKGVPILSSN